MKRLMLLFPLLLVGLLVTPAGALPGYASQDLSPVDGAPLRAGWVSLVQANGTVYWVETVHLTGADPNTTYAVHRPIHVGGCTNFFANFTGEATLTTDGVGNGTSTVFLMKSFFDPYPSRTGVTIGAYVEVLRDGNARYTSTCREYTLH